MKGLVIADLGLRCCEESMREMWKLEVVGVYRLQKLTYYDVRLGLRALCRCRGRCCRVF